MIMCELMKDAKLNTIYKLARLMVYTEASSFFFGLSASQASASSSYHHGIGRELFFSNVKTILFGDEFMNDFVICFVEQGFLATIPIDIVIV